MSSRDLLGVVFSSKEDAPALSAIEALTREGDHAAVLLMEVMPNPAFMAEGAIAANIWDEILAQTRGELAEEKRALDERCAAAKPAIETRLIESLTDSAGRDAAAQARHVDLTVMLRPTGASQQDQRSDALEEILFGSGRPVLLVPPAWRKAAIGRTIVVGWSAKREAARAVADAMPFLEAADRVVIVTVDAQPESGRESGEDIAAHLKRKGVKAEHRNVRAAGGDEGEALLAEARAIGADLIVIGGYGKTRLREWVFGGVTRTMTHEATIPLLLSH